MFRRNKDVGATGADAKEAHGPGAGGDISAPPLKPFSKKGSHIPSKPPGKTTSFRPEVPRRTADIPNIPRHMDRGRSGNVESRKLIVGKEIRLSGDITACDKLVVEGEVEVSLSDARVIEILPSGYFKGSADVEEAYISGRYDGELTVRGRLTVKAGGRISGTIRYGRIVIESGGEISGDTQALAQDSAVEADKPHKPKTS